MCGIVGYVGGGDAVAVLLDGLRRLEYRGYDSAGLAVVSHGVVERRRSAGKLDNLASILGREPLQGEWGVGHTRWATHGRPTERLVATRMGPSLVIGVAESARYVAPDVAALLPYTREVVSLGGAPKLKEISYLHAEGYPAGEMKHGPIALVDEELQLLAYELAVRAGRDVDQPRNLAKSVTVE